MRTTLEKTILDFFGAGWTAASRTEGVEYPNMSFSPVANEAWARISILEFDTGNPALGNRHKRTTGVVMVQVFVPVGSGSELKAALCDVVLGIFENKRTGSFVSFRRGKVSDVGTGSDGAWWQVNVSVPYRYDEVTT